MNAKNYSLKFYVFSSWLLSGFISLIASVILLTAFGFYTYQQNQKQLKINLENKAQIAARRISAELLIAPRGAPENIALQMQKDLGLSNLKIIREAIRNKKSVFTSDKNNLTISYPMPHLESYYQIRATIAQDSFWSYLNLPYIAWSLLITGIFIAVGVIVQTFYLQKKILKPIMSLVATSTGEKQICTHWPKELVEISEKLNHTFIEREQVVYSHLARGVIHDIRTLLQAVRIASDLAQENSTEKRLKNLIDVCRIKIPSVLEIVDTALDGSRDIKIDKKDKDLILTIKNAIETNKIFAEQKNIQLDFINTENELFVAHDSMQLERVFTNIIKNGIEAHLDAPVPNQKVQIKVDFSLKEKVSIFIEDNGLGLPKVHDNFFKTMKSTKPHGSGLGLLVSRKIIEAHDGQLRAGKSKELNGAQFEIELPRGASL